MWPHDGQLWLEWKPPNNTALSEYVIEWVGGGSVDWQRENGSTHRTLIKGKLSPLEHRGQMFYFISILSSSFIYQRS